MPAEEDESGEKRIKFVANPIQHQFITSRAMADLFCSRMGEGKSAGLVWSIFHHTMHNPGAYWIVCRDTWENCRETTLAEFFYWFPPGIMGEWNETKKTFTWKCMELRGKVVFIGMDEPRDAAKLQSRPLGGCAMDEPAPAANSGGIPEMIFDTALTRMRQRDMNWYACKLAQNNPDENHWTYKRFVDPGDERFASWKTDAPENLAHLPHDYYKDMAHALRHRPDLLKRFVKGDYGFTKEGVAVTPQFDERLHLSSQPLAPIGNLALHLLWDFGLDPVCIITQTSPTGRWNILEGIMHEDHGMGMAQLIKNHVKPAIAQRYSKARELIHIGDPNGGMREQSDSDQSAVKMILKELPGKWIPGPVSIPARVDPLNAVLSRQEGGIGIVQIDRDRAKCVWHALRGGWHKKEVGQVVSDTPVKNIHSHPGDATGYGAAKIFPQGDLRGPKHRKKLKPGRASYGRASSNFIGGKDRKVAKPPKSLPLGL